MSSAQKEEAPAPRRRLHLNKNKHQNAQLYPPSSQEPPKVIRERPREERPREVAGPSKKASLIKRLTAEEQKALLTFYAMRHYLQLRYNHLLSVNWREADVRPYKETPFKRIMPYRIRKVVSPFEFYLEYTEGYNFQQFFPEMQTFYNDPMNVKKMALIKGKVLLGRSYVCQDFTDGKWYRVRTHSVSQKRQTAVVFFCDYGKVQEVPFERLLEINRWFTRCSAQLFRAYLYDIVPVSSRPNSIVFSDEACQFFKHLVSDKEFHGIVLARSDMEYTHGLPDFVSEVGVVLFEKGPRPTASCSINAQMVENGYAQALGVLAACKHILHSEKIPEAKVDIDEMETLYPKEQPSTDKDNGTPSVTEEIEMSPILDNSSEFVPPPERTWLPECFQEVDKATEHLRLRLPQMLKERLAHIKLSYVLGPETIVLHIRSQVENMEKMQEILGRACSKLGSMSIEDLTPGMFVACHMNHNQTEHVDVWCRAILKGHVHHTAFKLLLIDFGNEVTIPQSHIRPLPDYFQKIPSFAHRVHLDVTGLKPAGSNCWSSTCATGFRKYVFSWEGNEPVYLIYRPPQSNWIELDDYTQGVIYKFDERKWIASPKKNIQANQAINAKKDHILLRSLFNTLGVDLLYEVLVRDSPFWHFQTVLDVIALSGFGSYDCRPKTAQQIHLSIVQQYEVVNVEKALDLASPNANDNGDAESTCSSATLTGDDDGYSKAYPSGSSSSQFSMKTDRDSTIANASSSQNGDYVWYAA